MPSQKLSNTLAVGRGTNSGTTSRGAHEAAIHAAIDAGDDDLAAELLAMMRRRRAAEAATGGGVDLEVALRARGR